MSTQRKLILSCAALVVLFALNLGVYFWGSRKHQKSMEDLQQAVARQLLLYSIQTRVNDLRKQIALLSEVYSESETNRGESQPQEIVQFEMQVAEVRNQIQELKNLSTDSVLQNVQTFSLSFEKLVHSWKTAYDNFGVENAKSIAELSLHADPLGQLVIQQMLPGLEKEEQHRVEVARARFYRVASVTDLVIVVIFFISILIVLGVAYRITRLLNKTA